MITMVSTASKMFLGSPKVLEPTPPALHLMATGSSETPMIVMTDPVTTSGKKCRRRVNTGASRRPTTPATSRAPKMARSPSGPPVLVPIARMVDTAANEVPWTRGWRAPSFQKPRVCNRVATPDMNRPADTM